MKRKGLTEERSTSSSVSERSAASARRGRVEFGTSDVTLLVGELEEG